MSQGDLPTAQAMPLIAMPKLCPEASWRMDRGGRIERWSLAVGAIVDDLSIRGAISIEICSLRPQRPSIQSHKMGLFYRSGGITRRVYMLEFDMPPLGREGDHDWPHEHYGADDQRFFSRQDCPKSFEEALTRFADVCNISFEEPPRDPLKFELT